MCSINNPLATAARRAADAASDMALLVCDATPPMVAAAVKHLKSRGDTRALAMLLVEVDRKAKRQTVTEGAFAVLGDPAAYTVNGSVSRQSVREAPVPPLFRSGKEPRNG